MSIGELCNRNVVIVGRDESVREAARLMRNHHVGDIVVVEERKENRTPVGIVTDRDLVVEVLAKDIDPESVTVGDVMSFELLTVHEQDSLWDVIPRMRHEGFRRVPVVNEAGGLEGILSIDDVIELLAEQTAGLAGLISREQQRERDSRP